MMKLYEVVAEMDACIDRETGEVNVEKLDALELAFNSKVGACVAVSKNLRADADAVDAEIKRLQAMKAAIENNRKRLLDYVLSQMTRAGVESVESEVHKVRRQKSPLSVTVVDSDVVPVRFKTEVREVKVDRKAIAEAVKLGETVDGIAISQGEHLRIS